MRTRWIVLLAALACMACERDDVGPRDAFVPDSSDEDLRSVLASYIDVEFGAPRHSEPISPAEFRYVGEFAVDGSQIQFWSFPCSFEPGCWAYVTSCEDAPPECEASIGWGATPPPLEAPTR